MELSFDPYSERLKQDHLNLYEGVKSDVMYTTKYDKNSNLWTTYLRISKMRRQNQLKKM